MPATDRSPALRITYIGGPTALLEWCGVRMLTDPTFDAAGETYSLPTYTLRKTHGPGIGPDAVGHVDAVLLSHDHHLDNLDRAGRAFLPSAGRVVTTPAAAERLGGTAIGLQPWATCELVVPGGKKLRVTATPARHGPAHMDRGPVIGFALEQASEPRGAVYVSGDTVWYEGVREVASRFDVRVALLFVGAARVSAAGDWPLTFTGGDAVAAAQAMPAATIVPLHFEDWEHFSESREDVDRAFRAAHLENRLRWPVRGKMIEVRMGENAGH